MAADAVAFLLSWMLVLAGYKWLGLVRYAYGHWYYVVGLGLMLVGFIATNALFSLYQGNPFLPGTPIPRILEMKRLVVSALLVHAGMLAVMYFRKDVNWSRFVTACSCGLIGLGTQSVRNHVRGWLHRYRVGQIPVLLVGANARTRQLAEILAHDPYSGYVVAGDVPFSPNVDLRGLRHVICCVSMAQFRVFVARRFDALAHVLFVPEQEMFLSSNVGIVDFQGMSGISVCNQTRVPAYRFAKRALEALLTACALVAAAPLLGLLAVLVKLTSRGPVFYVAERLGQEGRPIRIYKFRSMVQGASEALDRLLAENAACRAEWARSFKLAHDPRVTWFGRFMRRTSLDELPQLLNVLKGDLALIGPRPIVEKEIPLYGEAAWKVVCHVKPGITGLWQVSGRSETSYSERVRLDLQYVYNWSPWMDIWIFLRTLISVVRMRGAV